MYEWPDPSVILTLPRCEHVLLALSVAIDARR